MWLQSGLVRCNKTICVRGWLFLACLQCHNQFLLAGLEGRDSMLWTMTPPGSQPAPEPSAEGSGAAGGGRPASRGRRAGGNPDSAGASASGAAAADAEVDGDERVSGGRGKKKTPGEKKPARNDRSRRYPKRMGK